MDSDKTKRESLAIKDEKGKEKAPPRDRDQSAYSPVRAKDKADQAEFSDTTGAKDKPNSEEPLIARDNLKSGPHRTGSS